ncbi:unnamed protein product [Soboliphyme baturini]|uniref:Acyl-CoA_dh_N domain-containing protein n=1 Tax=Soboliphyme baturini TaxID=241478 RepID=A0A183I9P5_9BILA|nr:unnamed protein product [Soboliphyme baturini]
MYEDLVAEATSESNPCDVETEWQFIKSGILEAIAECCGFKRVGLPPGGSEKIFLVDMKGTTGGGVQEMA